LVVFVVTVVAVDDDGGGSDYYYYYVLLLTSSICPFHTCCRYYKTGSFHNCSSLLKLLLFYGLYFWITFLFAILSGTCYLVYILGHDRHSNFSDYIFVKLFYAYFRFLMTFPPTFNFHPLIFSLHHTSSSMSHCSWSPSG